MARDEEDWVGEPPEGRHSRDRADAGFWRDQPQARWALSLLGLFIVVAVVLVLLLG